MRRFVLTPLVASLLAVAFVESWAALANAARDAEIPHPGPWPWSVDGFIVAMALIVVEAMREARGRGVWWPRVGLVGATGLSTVIQAVYAPNDAWWLHAWSPLAVLFSFECLVWLVFGAGTVARLPEDFPEPVVPLGPEPEPDRAPAVPPAVPAAKTVARSLTPADREALRRVRHDPDRLARVAERRGIDPTVADATVAAWASRNGHKAVT